MDRLLGDSEQQAREVQRWISGEEKRLLQARRKAEADEER